MRKGILRLDESCISNSKVEISKWTGAVHSEISIFEFEMQDSSNLKIPFLITQFQDLTFMGALISRLSQALTKFQSRMTVKGDTLRTAAVSSTLSPPKNRNSTTFPLRGSCLLRRSRASSNANKSGARSGDATTASSRDIGRAPPPRFW